MSFCTEEAHVLASEAAKVIPLDRGQHVQLKPDVKELRYLIFVNFTNLSYFNKDINVLTLLW